MKKIKSFCFVGLFLMTFGFTTSAFAGKGYEMINFKCSDGSIVDMCRENNNATCNISDQTVCPTPPVIGG